MHASSFVEFPKLLFEKLTAIQPAAQHMCSLSCCFRRSAHPSFRPSIRFLLLLPSSSFFLVLINQYSFFFGFKFIFIYIFVLNMHSLLKNNLAVYSNHNDRHGRPVPPLPHRVHEWHEGSGVGHPHDESSLDIARRCVRCAAALMLLCCAVLCGAVLCALAHLLPSVYRVSDPQNCALPLITSGCIICAAAPIRCLPGSSFEKLDVS